MAAVLGCYTPGRRSPASMASIARRMFILELEKKQLYNYSSQPAEHT